MRHSKVAALLGILGIGLLSSGCQSSAQIKNDEMSTQESQASVTIPPNNTFISLSGTVEQARDDSFDLDYGEGVVLVEMDDFDFYPEGRSLLEDDQVMVYGYVDDELYETRSIEAQSVFVKNLGTQFYASGVDEEDFPAVGVLDFSPRLELTGTIAEVRGVIFELEAGSVKLDVDTSNMLYDPLDDEGYQKLEVGDRVRVMGILEDKLFNDLKLEADMIIELSGSPS